MFSFYPFDGTFSYAQEDNKIDASMTFRSFFLLKIVRMTLLKPRRERSGEN